MRWLTVVVLMCAVAVGERVAAQSCGRDRVKRANETSAVCERELRGGVGVVRRPRWANAGGANLPPSAPTAPAPQSVGEPPSAPPVPTAPATIATLGGRNYVVLGQPTVGIPPAPPSAGGEYTASLPTGGQTVVSPLAIPPPVMILDGPSPTVGAGGAGFVLPDTWRPNRWAR